MFHGLSVIRRASIPWGAIGLLGLILAVESWVSRQELVVSSNIVQGYAYACGAVAKALDADVLVMGDSQAKYGVIPERIAQRTGRRTHNLAVVAATPPMTYFLLKRVLDQGGCPGAIVVDFKSTQLQTDATTQVNEFARVLTLRECLDMAMSRKDSLHFARLLTRWSLPSLRYRWGIQGFLVTSFRGHPSSEAPANLTAFRNWNVNRGAWLKPKNPAVEGPGPYWDENLSFQSSEFWCEPHNAEYVRRFLALAASRKIAVYWVVPPINPRLQVKRDRYGYDKRYSAMLKRAVAQWPNLTIIDGRHAGYPTRVFVDATHLDMEGACVFSEELGGLIGRGRPAAGSRYVDLPAYHPHALPPGLEDENLSRYVLFGGPRPSAPEIAGLPTGLRR